MDDSLASRIPAPTTYRDHSVEILRGLALSGTLASGSRINEVELAQRLGISRGPLREAVRELVAEGLLVSAPGRGAFVKSYSEDELRKLYELRTALESWAVDSLSASVDVAPVREAFERARALTDADDPDYARDLEFHSALVALTGNEFLIDAARTAHRQVMLAGSAYGYDIDRARRASHEHGRVLTAIDNGDIARAARELRAHLSATCERAIAAMRHG